MKKNGHRIYGIYQKTHETMIRYNFQGFSIENKYCIEFSVQCHELHEFVFSSVEVISVSTEFIRFTV